MKNSNVYICAFILAFIGVALFAYKTLVVGFPVVPGKLTPTWEIEARFEFAGTGGPVKVTTYYPRSQPWLKIQDPRIIAPGYGVTKSESRENVAVVLAKRAAGPDESIYVKFIANRFPSHEKPDPDSAPKIIDPKFDDVAMAAAQELIRQARDQSADTLTLASALLKILNADPVGDSAAQILGRTRNTVTLANSSVAILAAASIPARRVSGLDLSGAQKNAKIARWIEVFDGTRWVEFSILTGEPKIPATYLPWWYGSNAIVTVEGAGRPKRTLSFTRLQETSLGTVLAEGRRTHSQLVTLSLFGLPLATQDVYRVLMVVPLGIFILVIIRNVIGLRSLGTFMPVLIALAFRETRLLWGIILFTSVISAGLLFRAYLEYLKLLLVPRLASVLIFVVLFMAGLSVVANQLGFVGGLSVALFPMVIMSMTIERISVIWDELGPRAAMKQAFGSLAIAALCYLVMSNALVEHLFFTFPELLLLLLAGTMLLGRYSGYRLLELPRFKVLAGDDH